MSRFSLVGGGAVGTLAALSALAATAGTWKLLGISWVAFGAMTLGIPLGRRTLGDRSWALVWGYGLAAGAMVTSAAVFLVPQAIAHDADFGGFGIALGLLVGFAGHTIGHRLAHYDLPLGFAGHTIGHRLAHYDLPLDRTVAELSAHAVSAGLIIGIVYGNMPDLGPILGLAIVSHKGPAGYAAARRLVSNGRDPTVLLLPAAGVGIAAIVASLIQLPAAPPVRGVVFGFAAGIFLHVAMDFLPRCEIGSDVHELLTVTGDAHELLDRLRIHAVLSTSLGGVAVFLAWLAVT